MAGAWSRYRPQEAGLIIVIVLIGVVLTFGGGNVSIGAREVNNFFRLDNLVPNVLTNMSWYAIMSLGATIVIATGGIDISVGSVLCLSALGTAALFERLHLAENASGWVVLPLAILTPMTIGTLCGLINGALVVGLRMHPFIVTLGTLSIFRGIALIAVPTKTLPTPDYSLPTALTEHFIAWQWRVTIGESTLMVQPAPMLIMIACGVITWVFLANTVSGRRVYAVGGNEEAARFSGINVGRVKLLVYALSGLSAGIAGLVILGYNKSASSNSAEGWELMVIAAAVVGGASLSGGRGTALGAVLGALVIKLIDHGTYIIKTVNLGFIAIPMSKEYTKIIVGIAIILAVAVDRVSEAWRARRS